MIGINTTTCKRDLGNGPKVQTGNQEAWAGHSCLSWAWEVNQAFTNQKAFETPGRIASGLLKNPKPDPSMSLGQLLSPNAGSGFLKWPRAVSYPLGGKGSWVPTKIWSEAVRRLIFFSAQVYLGGRNLFEVNGKLNPTPGHRNHLESQNEN